MATCKDCVHVEVCGTFAIASETFEISSPERIASSCDDFKARSRFVELSHAEWIEDEEICDYLIYRCSNCNERFVLEEGTPTDNCYFYCPNCGAKMDKQALKERENNAN